MKILFAATVDIHLINHHLRIMHSLHETGNEIHAAASGDYTNADISKKYNVCFSKNPLSPDNLKAFRKMKQILKEEDYDVISCHTPISSFFVRLAARKTRAKVIYTAHGFHFFQGAPFINRTVYYGMEKFAAKFTDTLVTINEEDFNAASRFRLKPGGEVKLIPGVGIDLEKIRNMKTDRITAGKLLNIPEDAFVCMSVGEVNQNKNQLFVLEALSDRFVRDNLYYVICGRGPLEETVREKARQLGLEDRVILTGYREDVLSLLGRADLFFSPSHREGLPVCVMEAQALGVPVIASDVRGNHDLIVHGENGLLYADDDTEDFRRCFDLLFGNPRKAAELAERAKETVKAYSKEIIDPMILALYTEEKSLVHDRESVVK